MPYLPWPDPWGCCHPGHSPGPHFIPWGYQSLLQRHLSSAGLQLPTALPCPATHSSVLWPLDQYARPQTHLITMDSPGDLWPWFWPWPAAWLPGFQAMDLPPHDTLAWWPRLWAEAGSTSGSALLSHWRWWDSHCPAGSLPVVLHSAAGFPALQPLLHPNMKGREIHKSFPRHEKAYEALKWSLMCLCCCMWQSTWRQMDTNKRVRRCQRERGWARNVMLPLYLLGFRNMLDCM